MSKARDIADRGSSIDSSEITDGAVTSSKLASGAAAINIGTGGVTSSMLAEGAVEGAMVTPSGRRNLIINGDFRVAQRGTTFTQTNNAYHLDRWLIQNTNDVNQQVTQSTDVPSNQGFKNSIKWAVYGSNKVGLSELRQKVEDTLVANGRSVTLSFWAKCDIANIHSVGIGDNVNATSVTISNTAWTYYTLTRDNINSTSVLDVIIYANGNTASVGDALWITGVQLEVGSVATPFEHRSFGEELALCQRYYHFTSGDWPYRHAISGNYSGTGLYPVCYFPVEMRTTPSLTVSSGTGFRVETYSGQIQQTTGVSFNTANTKHAVLTVTCASNFNNGGNLNGYSGSRLSWDAEL